MISFVWYGTDHGYFELGEAYLEFNDGRFVSKSSPKEDVLKLMDPKLRVWSAVPEEMLINNNNNKEQ